MWQKGDEGVGKVMEWGLFDSKALSSAGGPAVENGSLPLVADWSHIERETHCQRDVRTVTISNSSLGKFRLCFGFILRMWEFGWGEVQG